MAFNNSISARYDELRSPNPPSSSNPTGTNTPSSRYSGSFLPNHSQAFGTDARTSLQRRQTTDLSKMPAMTPIGQQPPQAMEPVDMSASVSCSTFQSSNLLKHYFLLPIFMIKVSPANLHALVDSRLSSQPC